MLSANLRRKLPPAGRMPAVSPHDSRGEDGPGGHCRPLQRMPHSGPRSRGPNLSFREELKGLCARPKCRQAHHQLLHLEGKPEPRPCHHSGRNTAALNQHRTQIVATMMHLAEQPPVQLVTQRIRTTAGKPCVTFWDIGSQVTLMTQGAAKDMGLKPIPDLLSTRWVWGMVRRRGPQCGTKFRWSTPGGERWR
jgi:hypothetical protein